MENQAESGIVDALRERLASPFLFTYFWLMCAFNWKIIYWFIYEPLKPSLKFESIPKDLEWSYFGPLWLTILVVIFVPWLNNFAEVTKEWAVNSINKFLNKRGWKKMVSAEDYDKVQGQLSSSKQEVIDLLERYDKAQQKQKEAQESQQETLTELTNAQEKYKNLQIENKDSNDEYQRIIEELKATTQANIDYKHKAEKQVIYLKDQVNHLENSLSEFHNSLEDEREKFKLELSTLKFNLASTQEQKIQYVNSLQKAEADYSLLKEEFTKLARVKGDNLNYDDMSQNLLDVVQTFLNAKTNSNRQRDALRNLKEFVEAMQTER